MEMSCVCGECESHGGPDPNIMKARFLILGAQFLIAVPGMIKERSWKALAAFLVGLAFFATVPRLMICCRCEGYGRKCYSLYLGKITSLYLPRVEGGNVGRLGMFLEVFALSLINDAPLVGLRRNRKLLAWYLLFSTLTVVFQFLHSCRHCAGYATDWRKDCPAASAARKLFFAGNGESPTTE